MSAVLSEKNTPSRARTVTKATPESKHSPASTPGYDSDATNGSDAWLSVDGGESPPSRDLSMARAMVERGEAATIAEAEVRTASRTATDKSRNHSQSVSCCDSTVNLFFRLRAPHMCAQEMLAMENACAVSEADPLAKAAVTAMAARSNQEKEGKVR